MEKVLNDGFVELVDHMGSDQRILQAARVSTGAESKGEKKDRGLINYLLKNKHMTPFEKVVFEFHVRAPIFVARQWFRHRIGSFNEESARYKEFEWSCFEPEQWRHQGNKNHQASSDETFDSESEEAFFSALDIAYRNSQDAYDGFLENDVVREQARTVMPVGQYTEFYWTVNFRALMNFLTLRNHDHAQPEIQAYARVIEGMVNSISELRYSMDIFKKMKQVDHLILDAVNKYKSLDNLIDYLGHFVRAENDYTVEHEGTNTKIYF